MGWVAGDPDHEMDPLGDDDAHDDAARFSYV